VDMLRGKVRMRKTDRQIDPRDQRSLEMTNILFGITYRFLQHLGAQIGRCDLFFGVSDYMRELRLVNVIYWSSERTYWFDI
jgi:hypothetical protein